MSVFLKDLKLGDVVQMNVGGVEDAYMCATVVRVDTENDVLEMVRPYVHISDVEYGGGRVIDYLGTERMTFDPTIETSEKVDWVVVRKGGKIR